MVGVGGLARTGEAAAGHGSWTRRLGRVGERRRRSRSLVKSTAGGLPRQTMVVGLVAGAVAWRVEDKLALARTGLTICRFQRVGAWEGEVLPLWAVEDLVQGYC